MVPLNYKIQPQSAQLKPPRMTFSSKSNNIPPQITKDVVSKYNYKKEIESINKIIDKEVKSASHIRGNIEESSYNEGIKCSVLV